MTWSTTLVLLRHIANNSLFINIATILFCLNIEPSEDAPPDIEGSHNTGLVVCVMVVTADEVTLTD